MRLRSYGAALSEEIEGLADLQGVDVVPRPNAVQTRSAAAFYAIQAVEALDLGESQPALYCITGPSGSTLHLLERARDPTHNSRLIEGDFGRHRSRRIHPFTLLLSLQNQVAASVSLRFGWHGPCTNAVESSAAFVDLIPSIELSLRQRSSLVVLSSAADRREDRSWYTYRARRNRILEGAVALLFDPDGELGQVTLSRSGESLRLGGEGAAPPFRDWPVAPCLEAGLAVLWALAQGIQHARFELVAAERSTFFDWSHA